MFHGELAPLTGIPYSAKDSLSTRGVNITCSSKILENYKPFYDCTAIQKLKTAGAVLLGKNNMDEFGMGSSTENSGFFTTRNPWDPDFVPGGSSGGSAAAVAAGMAAFALGEDTGGSVGMPAGFCGFTGLKTTYGRVSRYGLLPLVSSFDTIGPMARSAYDAALVLEAIAGHDPKDSTSRMEPVQQYSDALKKAENLRGLRVGIPREYFVQGLDPEMDAALRSAIQQIESLGAQAVEVSLPHTRYAIPVFYLVLFAEASSNLARYDGGLNTRLLQLATAISGDLSRYFATVTLINLLLGIATTATMYWLGMPNPLLWGMVAFLLNYVPNAGSATTLVLLTVVAVVSFEGLGKAFAVAGCYLALAAIEGQVLQPILVGRRLDVSPLVVFLSLWFGGWLWGVAGVALAVPLLVTAKALAMGIGGLEPAEAAGPARDAA